MCTDWSVAGKNRAWLKDGVMMETVGIAVVMTNARPYPLSERSYIVEGGPGLARHACASQALQLV